MYNLIQMAVPLGIYVVFHIAVLFMLYLRIEQIQHEHVLKALPIKVWVNGTRGKSSVTRLIAAGIRSKNIKVIAKTTGTKARFINDNDSEEPVDRISQPNIHEQMTILKKARAKRPEAVVLECMALRPDLQYTEARRIVKPDIVVITNVRADHLDVMGPTLKDVAYNFINALPKGCRLVTTDRNIFSEFKKMIEHKKIAITIVDENTIDDRTMQDFKYIEHKENITLALSVCNMIGADTRAALRSTQNSLTD